jgi:sulfate transport system substrate-binding protein
MIFLSDFTGLALDGEITLLNVSYDPTRELFTAYNAQFIAHYQKLTGHAIKINQSHGGSGKQARSIIEGLRADVATLALAYDIQVIANHRLINADWESRLPFGSSPYTSTIVFLVRKDNPKKILDWSDLIRPDVKVITPNPKTSGGARWNLLAAWGFITIGKRQSEAVATDFIRRLYLNVPVLDSGARGSTTTFAQKEIGDVYLTWENESRLALREYGTNMLCVVYPSMSILAQPCVSLVDRNVNRRGPDIREAAEEYLRFLYTDAMQELIARHGYRPANKEVLAKYSDRYPPMRLFTIQEVAGSWEAAQKKFFSEDGIFDKIYRP